MTELALVEVELAVVAAGPAFWVEMLGLALHLAAREMPLAQEVLAAVEQADEVPMERRTEV